MVPARVLLVDDHEIARKGIRSVLTTNAELVVVSEAVDGEEAVRKSQELHPDVIPDRGGTLTQLHLEHALFAPFRATPEALGGAR